jgi:hypothetical protein
MEKRAFVVGTKIIFIWQKNIEAATKGYLQHRVAMLSAIGVAKLDGRALKGVQCGHS